MLTFFLNKTNISNPMHRYSKQLGEQLADMHSHNKRQLEKLGKEQQTVGNDTEIVNIS